MANRSYLMPDLIEKASKLSIDDLDTNKSPSSISRYQEFPYAHFYDMNKIRDPASLKKTSPEYHERVRKALKALEEKYLEAYQVYQTWKDELILQIEDHDQHSWNNFILDPRDRMGFGDGILEDLETFLDFSNTCYPFPSCKSQERFSKTLFKRRVELAEIKGLIETGRRELARLEGSDSLSNFAMTLSSITKKLQPSAIFSTFVMIRVVARLPIQEEQAEILKIRKRRAGGVRRIMDKNGRLSSSTAQAKLCVDTLAEH